MKTLIYLSSLCLLLVHQHFAFFLNISSCHNIMISDPNYQWEDLLDINDFDLPLTHVLHPCNRHVRETITITSTQNTNGIVQVEETPVSIRLGLAGIVQVEKVEEKPVRIILGPAGIVQLAKICKQSDIHEGGNDSVLSTQEYMKQVVEDAGEDEDFNSGSWLGANEFVKANGDIVSGCIGDIKTFLKNEKLEQVVAIIKSCSSNALSDLKVTVKDLSGTLPGSIHYKVINEGGYRKEITVGSDIILANVLVFSPNPSMHYLNITKKNAVTVFHKDFVPGNGNGVGGSGLLMEEEEIVKLIERIYTTEGGGALGANKEITHLVIAIFMYPLRAVEAACALEVDAMGALDHVEVEAV
ncbi:hypothetical protein Tco_1248479 [Tanacetum coccineum]